MSSDFPTFAEVGERNIWDAIARDEIQFRIIMRHAPRDFIEQEGVAK